MSNTNTAPYLAFVRSALADIAAQGLPTPTLDPNTPSGLPENDGYCFIEWGAHGVAPAIIVPKSKLRMGSLHSHVDLSGLDGHIPLPKKNGRVVCHFEPDVRKVSKAFARFVGASKAPVAAPVRRTVATPSGASRVASGAPVALPPGPSEYDTGTPVLPPVAQPALTDMFPGLAGDRDSQVDEALAALEA